ncbi:Hypothetical protein CINCED_3A025269 [Cinara cedri]|uniref:Uncharacterized protein n=1 Tax=Cinara cedri TaxID=506608 RepID=A0A5E4MXH1_9HEMI|nr:Hypothetical protein CINCED_3A025269 [Cinara cedri]
MLDKFLKIVTWENYIEKLFKDGYRSANSLPIMMENKKDNVSNQECMQKEKELLRTIKTQKLEYQGHIVRNNQRYELLQLILQGKIEGKKNVGIRKKNLRE